MRPHEAMTLAEVRERELRFEAIRDWATYAVADPKLHQLAATAIRGLAARLTVDGAGAMDECSLCSVATESGPGDALTSPGPARPTQEVRHA